MILPPFPRRWPFWPSLLVGLVVAGLLALGIVNLHKAADGRALRALARVNPAKPAMSFPRFAPIPPEAMFRRSSLYCLSVIGWHVEAGRGADGRSGFLYVAQCATGAEGPGALVAVGVAGRPDLRPRWSGGRIGGWVSQEKVAAVLPQWIEGKALPPRPMLVVAASPEAGMAAPQPPQRAVARGPAFLAALALSAAALLALGYALALGYRQKSGRPEAEGGAKKAP